MKPKKGNVVYDKVIIADVKTVLQKLNETGVKKTSPEWMGKCLHWKETLPLTKSAYEDSAPVDLYNLAGKLSETMKNGTILITDADFEELIVPSNVRLKKTQACVHPFMQGTMGFALPAVVGASAAARNARPIVAVIGDGSMMMNLQELETIASNGIPAKSSSSTTMYMR